MDSLRKNSFQFAFLAASLVWLLFSFYTSVSAGVFSDEFIYFHRAHLSANFFDFIFYKPAHFFGHPPLVSFLHWSLSPFGMMGLRLFHVLGLWLVIVCFWPNKLWQYFCCLFLLLHPTFLTHSTFLYPEIIQGFLGLLIWRLFKRGDFKLCGVIFFIALLWRESSLAFLIGLLPSGLLLSRYRLKHFIYFLPGLIFLIAHFLVVSFSDSWNPGRLAAQGRLPSWSESFAHLNQTAAFLLGIGLFYPLIGWPLFSFLKGRVQRIRRLQQVEVLFLFISLGVLLFLIFDHPVGDSWEFFLRLRSLGFLGLILVLGIGFFSAPTQWPQETIFSFVAAAGFFVFFLVYRDISSRDLIPAGILMVFGLSFLRPNKALFFMMIISFNIALSLHFSRSVEFLEGAAAGLNGEHRRYYLNAFNKSLEQASASQTLLDSGVVSVARNSFFVTKSFPEKEVKQPTSFLSYKRDLELPIIEQNVAFTLYSLKGD